jgi:hypothetical protein
VLPRARDQAGRSGGYATTSDLPETFSGRAERRAGEMIVREFPD